MKKNQAFKRVFLDKDSLVWLRQTYPKGSLSWTLNMLLKQFRRAHTMRPRDYAEVGARELKKMIERASGEGNSSAQPN